MLTFNTGFEHEPASKAQNPCASTQIARYAPEGLTGIFNGVKSLMRFQHSSVDKKEKPC
jgi:hypothetical protein